MAITSNCAEIIITNPQGSVSFNKLITTTELSPAKTIYSEDRVYLIQNSENVPQTFWWNLEKAIADGYADLEELYDYFVAEIANQCGGGGGGTQTLAISGNDLSISGGNTVVLPPDTTQVSVSKNGTLVGITDKLNFVAGTNTTVDVDNILGVYRIKFNNSSLQSLQAGAGIGIDITNPLSPIVYALQKMQIALTDRSNNIVASTIVHEFIVLENFEITSSPFISLVTAPTGANFILQIQKNGVEVGINTKALVVTAGTNVSTATTDFNGVTFAKGDRISFRVTQIGSVNAGKGLDILLNFKN